MKAYCAICTDRFSSENTITSTICGHVFHEVCLLQWIEHSKTCPECRQNCTEKKIKRIYFNFNDEEKTTLSSEQIDAVLERVRADLLTSKTELSLKKNELVKIQDDASRLRCLVIKAETEASQYKNKYYDSRNGENAMKTQLKQTLQELGIMKKSYEENKKLRDDITHLKNVEVILKGSQKEIDETINSWGNGAQNVQQMATYLALLKRELGKCRNSKEELQNEIKIVKKELGYTKCDLRNKNSEIKMLKTDLTRLREDKDNLEMEIINRDIPNKDTPNSLKRTANKSLFEDEEPTPPNKKPKINMINTFVNKLKDRDQLSNCGNLTSGKNLFRENRKVDEDDDDDSTIRQGFNGLGGHSKFITRSTPIQIKMTKKGVKSFKRPLQQQINTLKDFY